SARGIPRVIATVELPAQVTQLRQAAQTLGIELQVEKIDILNERDRHRIASFEVDVLINNAGIGESGAVVDIPVDVIRSQFETNVFSAFDLTQKFAKKLISEKRRGKIIF
ncbi:SDR family NAD(P)-dependent oxidoreductase, partial [Pseudomonas aeruginosa]|uniref:SDR family NAD(P)-dependent oxidoreductase n=1 Tax=Pseudomonas aeruginosa TaxID=287 RepID=UPI000577C361